MSLNISIETKGFDQAEKALKGIDGAFPKIAAKAINYGLKGGNALAANLINKRYNIKSGDIKDQMKVEKANYSRLDGSLGAKGSMLPVSLFSPKVVRLKKLGNRQRVTVSIVRKRGKVLKGAFEAKGRIWERRPVGTTVSNAPLGIISTIGIPHMVGYLGIAKQVEDRIEEQIEKRLEHLVKYELSKHH